MIRDKLGTYAEDTTAENGGSVVGTDYIDHGAEGFKIGGAQVPQMLNIVVTSDFTTTNSETWRFELEVDSDSGFTTDKKTIIRTRELKATELQEGAHFEIPVPAEGLRYSRVTSTRTGSTDNPGKVDVFLSY